MYILCPITDSAYFESHRHGRPECKLGTWKVVNPVVAYHSVPRDPALLLADVIMIKDPVQAVSSAHVHRQVLFETVHLPIISLQPGMKDGVQVGLLTMALHDRRS